VSLLTRVEGATYSRPIMDDVVFRALGDPRRRKLLDGLHERDGRTLGELEQLLPELTRFGVMRHVRLLEAAGLITTQRAGRRKFHYLNPVPIRLIHDRWIRRYEAPFVDAMVGLRNQLEVPQPMNQPTYVQQIYIRTTPEELWRALTDPEFTQRYWYGALSKSDWTPGARWTSESPEGQLYLEGEILEIEPPRRLVHTFHILGDQAAAKDAPSKVTWEITPMGDSCRLRFVHEDMGAATKDYVTGGWEYILSGLKTLLETGEPLKVGEPSTM
jgi:uncharacterized protein YndB with AHSA1/START domain/DNA-binding transcriptional ArsR family regulator